MTPSVLPSQLIRNIEWIHSFYQLNDLFETHSGLYQDSARRMLAQIGKSPWMLLHQFCEDMDTRFGLRSGDGLMLFRHLLAVKAILCDMNTLKLNDQLTMGNFRLALSEHQETQA